jgi:hypothetical protein
MPGRPMTTPSMTMETEVSTPGEVEMVPMPRTKMVRSLLDAPVRKSIEGTVLLMSCMSLRAWTRAWAPVTTETAIGTFWTDSKRWRAVTTTSPGADAPGPALAAGAVWPTAAVAKTVSAVAPISTPTRRADLCKFIFSNSPENSPGGGLLIPTK